MTASIGLPVTNSTIFVNPGQKFRYTSIQVPCDAPAAGAGSQAPSLDVMARQIAAGYRSAGALFGGHSGGSLSADSLDLVPPDGRAPGQHAPMG